jgi:hypothetical protein
MRWCCIYLQLNSGVPRDVLDNTETEALVLRCVKPMYDVFQMFCLNRALVQRRTKRVMGEWASVQNDAEHTLNETLFQRRARAAEAALSTTGQTKDVQPEKGSAEGGAGASANAAADVAVVDEGEAEAALPYLAYWAQEWSLRVMITRFTLGFELNL